MGDLPKYERPTESYRKRRLKFVREKIDDALKGYLVGSIGTAIGGASTGVCIGYFQGVQAMQWYAWIGLVGALSGFAGLSVALYAVYWSIAPSKLEAAASLKIQELERANASFTGDKALHDALDAIVGLTRKGEDELTSLREHSTFDRAYQVADRWDQDVRRALRRHRASLWFDPSGYDDAWKATTSESVERQIKGRKSVLYAGGTKPTEMMQKWHDLESTMMRNLSWLQSAIDAAPNPMDSDKSDSSPMGPSSP